jgi:hypothetical protein
VVVLGVLAALLLVATGESRRRAGLAASEENLGRLGGVTASYAGDNADLYWGFSWKAGDKLSQWGDLNNAPGDNEAHANQAVDIIRRRADVNFPRQFGWIADVFYSYLVLADYLDEPLPMTYAASPADGQLRGWQVDKQTAPNVRLPYSSSYELPTAFYDKSEVGMRISQSTLHNTFSIPGGVVLGARTTADVAFPSQKVHLYDRYQRQFGNRTAFFAYPEARLPLLFADGSVDVRKTGDGNRGWQPNSPTSPQPTVYTYQPQEWEAPIPKGESSQLYGYLRWTRAGIAGRDYGGPEVGPPP